MLWQERLFIAHSGISLIFVSSMLFLSPYFQYLKYYLGSSGTGAGMDIVVSSVRAYVSALNKMLGFRDSETKLSAGKSQVSVWEKAALNYFMPPAFSVCRSSKTVAPIYCTKRGRSSCYYYHQDYFLFIFLFLLFLFFSYVGLLLVTFYVFGDRRLVYY